MRAAFVVRGVGRSDVGALVDYGEADRDRARVCVSAIYQFCLSGGRLVRLPYEPQWHDSNPNRAP